MPESRRPPCPRRPCNGPSGGTFSPATRLPKSLSPINPRGASSSIAPSASSTRPVSCRSRKTRRGRSPCSGRRAWTMAPSSSKRPSAPISPGPSRFRQERKTASLSTGEVPAITTIGCGSSPRVSRATGRRACLIASRRHNSGKSIRRQARTRPTPCSMFSAPCFASARPEATCSPCWPCRNL